MSEPIKKEENKILKKYSIEEVKNMVVKQARTVDDLNSIYRELGNEILPKYFDGNEEDKKEVEEKLNSRVTQVMMTLETETHLGVMETFDPTYREMSKELCSKIIKENNCDSSLEKTLVEVIVISFIRINNSREKYLYTES
jgi:hypothetical protein